MLFIEAGAPSAEDAKGALPGCASQQCPDQQVVASYKATTQIQLAQK